MNTIIAAMREALRTVVDPEVGVNVVDLGLVYDIVLAEGRIRIDLTMTSPACPMGEMMLDDVKAAAQAAAPAGVPVDVELVWEPAWDPAMMSDAARDALGWLES
ncbi:metal-sulfur cluster assembly factor [Paraburkholderia kururiensis]|uniref:Metal-sulfur cluster assembly factor n=1 Tax=Paraburkholderia kururiensis TaxID=984307 RepID=A0ABZ0WFT0_9BURK|nr:metal-sulfur cluster assembly factor [Paraburkholderia kururiensis]WQD76188.1 metal-sulfur cluster assembly factor [Paraburkholderia kururiensis]